MSRCRTCGGEKPCHGLMINRARKAPLDACPECLAPPARCEVCGTKKAPLAVRQDRAAKINAEPGRFTYCPGCLDIVEDRGASEAQPASAPENLLNSHTTKEAHDVP